MTLSRMRIVEIAANHPLITQTLRGLQRPFVNAMMAYIHAADSAAQVLGHDQRRALIATDDGALPTRHDPGEIYALLSCALTSAKRLRLLPRRCTRS